MTVSELLASSQDVSNSSLQAACRLCLRRDRTSSVISSPVRKLMKCKGCGVTYLEPQPQAEMISEHLAERYITLDEQVEINFGRLREAVMSRVAARIQERKGRGRILDVGCAGGYFLHRYFSASGWDLHGVEPSRFAARVAENKGLRIFQGELRDVVLPATHFDVVTIFDTLSYFREPQIELGVIRRAMRPDALLVVEQPISSTHIWRHNTIFGRLLGGAPMSLLENGQNFLYDPRSMRHLFRQTGFHADDFETLPGNKQRDLLRDLLFGGYFLLSRFVWHLSGRNEILGPNFVVFASLSNNY